MEETENKYNLHYSQTNKAWEAYAHSTDNHNLFTGFRKHCVNTEEYASHNCCRFKKSGESKKCHFICVYNTGKKIKLILSFVKIVKKYIIPLIYYLFVTVAMLNIIQVY